VLGKTGIRGRATPKKKGIDEDEEVPALEIRFLPAFIDGRTNEVRVGKMLVLRRLQASLQPRNAVAQRMTMMRKPPNPPRSELLKQRKKRLKRTNLNRLLGLEPRRGRKKRAKMMKMTPSR
jgi:hypothetical protein